MSNVNQAFLRAYIKNRAAVDLAADPLPHADESANSATAPLSGDDTQQLHIRIDRRTPQQPSTQPSDMKHPMPNMDSGDTHSYEPPAPGTGFWSPLGVERGMKGSISQSQPPAVVRNGRDAVPVEATLQRIDRSHATSRAVAPPQATPAQQTAAPNFVQQNTAARNTVSANAMASNPTASRQATPPYPNANVSQALPAQNSGSELPPAASYRVGPTPENFVKKRAPALKLPPRNPPANIPLPTMPGPSSPSAPSNANAAPSLHAEQAHAEPRGSALPPAGTAPDLAAIPDDYAQSKSIYFPPQPRIDNPPQTMMRGPHFRTDPNSVADQQRGHGSTTMRMDTPASAPASIPNRQPTTEQSIPAMSSPQSYAAQNSRSAPPTAQPQIDRQKFQKLPLPVAFSPSWEVDTFFWPEVVLKLEQVNPTAFLQVGHHLATANQSGLKVMAVTSGERGVGRSTVAMHLARAAASAGLKVALVDADAFAPSLIDQLRLDIENGWQNCLFEAVPLEEAAVHSIADNVTLFPLTSLISQQQLHANLHRMAKLMRRISTAFDMVFLDSCRLNLDQRDLVGVSNEVVIDAAVLVMDSELSIKEKVDSAVSILQGMGLDSIGLVENFRS